MQEVVLYNKCFSHGFWYDWHFVNYDLKVVLVSDIVCCLFTIRWQLTGIKRLWDLIMSKGMQCPFRCYIHDVYNITIQSPEVHSKGVQQRKHISKFMAYCKKHVTLLLTHWSYAFLALTPIPKVCYIYYIYGWHTCMDFCNYWSSIEYVKWMCRALYKTNAMYNLIYCRSPCNTITFIRHLHQ